MKALNKYLLILLSCFIFSTSCQICEKLGIVDNDQQTTKKVVGGKVVEIDSNGELIPASNKSPKINIPSLIWWAAVLTAIALGVRHFTRSRHDE